MQVQQLAIYEMKAVGLYKYLPIEDPQSLVDLDIPQPDIPGSGHDLLVAIKAISVNPVDTKVRRGLIPITVQIKKNIPRISGWDAAGEVIEVGSDCTLFKKGDAVYYARSISRPLGTNCAEVERSDDDKHDILHTYKQRIYEIEESTKGMKPPYRFVGKTVSDVETKEGMKFGILLEKSGQQHFDELNCSLLCYYDISKIEPTRKDEWISSLLRNHHYVIYASEPNKAVAFETELLEQDKNM